MKMKMKLKRNDMEKGFQAYVCIANLLSFVLIFDLNNYVYLFHRLFILKGRELVLAFSCCATFS